MNSPGHPNFQKFKCFTSTIEISPFKYVELFIVINVLAVIPWSRLSRITMQVQLCCVEGTCLSEPHEIFETNNP